MCFLEPMFEMLPIDVSSPMYADDADVMTPDEDEEVADDASSLWSPNGIPEQVSILSIYFVRRFC